MKFTFTRKYYLQTIDFEMETGNFTVQIFGTRMGLKGQKYKFTLKLIPPIIAALKVFP